MPRSRAFSIIELLVVIMVIAIIVAILLPALSGTRTATKKTDTEALCTQLSQSISRFEGDTKRLPGRFSVRDLAQVQNATRGMSMAENIMLDLGGVTVQDTPPATMTPDWVQVGPYSAAAKQVWVNTVGLSQGVASPGQGGSYFVPPARYYVPQAPGSQVGVAGHTAATGGQLFDLVDSFGQPLLVWMEDQATSSAPLVSTTKGSGGRTAMAGDQYDAAAIAAGTTGPAKFYWNTNGAFLRSTALGALRADQTGVSPESGTFLASQAAGEHVEALAALLGNPAFPGYPPDAQGNPNLSVAATQIYPTAARGRYVIHSAGADGRYMGRNVKLNKGATFANAGVLRYGACIKDAAGNRYADSLGQATTVDLAKEFDDVLVAGQ